MNSNSCPNCGNIIPENDDFCSECGTHRIVSDENYCVNKVCDRYKDSSVVKPNQKYCGKCGNPTLFQTRIEKYL